MAWKAALAALLLVVVVAADGEVGHGGHAAVPLRRRVARLPACSHHQSVLLQLVIVRYP
jgi:hypothetical protein